MSSLNFSLFLVYFVYGLAFFSMGLAMVLEAQRSPLLADSRVLWPLALFGLVHGAHEWLEMMLMVREWFGLAVPPYLPWVRLGLLVVSFSFLLGFSLLALRPQNRWLSKNDYWVVAIALTVYSGIVVATSFWHQDTPQNWTEHADALARYFLAVPAALLAGLALIRRARQVQVFNRRGLTLALRVTAAGFLFYGLTQLVVAPTDLFPARYINAQVFTRWFGFPVQVVRALLAAAITTGLYRASQIAEDERRRQLVKVQQERVDALEQVRQELLERGAMRRELLRHTVIAQEDERARIARELHDETAQFLTALTLNLATLKNDSLKEDSSTEIIDRLQQISRKMSQGIYRMVHDLRPAQLDDLGLVPALQYLVDEEKNRTSIEVLMRVEGSRQRLDPLVETVLFRVAQEALINVARHAGCGAAAILLKFEAEQVSLQVIDEGVGFNPLAEQRPPHGWGVAGMRERVESVSGKFDIISAPGEGTIVSAIIPLAQANSFEAEEKSYEYHPLDAGR